MVQFLVHVKSVLVVSLVSSYSNKVVVTGGVKDTFTDGVLRLVSPWGKKRLNTL